MPVSNSILPIPMTTGTSYKCSCPTSTHRGRCPLSMAIIRLVQPQRGKKKGASLGCGINFTANAQDSEGAIHGQGQGLQWNSEESRTYGPAEDTGA